MAMSEAEQLLSIEILDAHNAEAVLLASMHQSYDVARELEGAEAVRVRDQWRLFLTHDLGGVGTASVHDAAVVSGTGPDPLPLAEFIADSRWLGRVYARPRNYRCGCRDRGLSC